MVLDREETKEGRLDSGISFSLPFFLPNLVLERKGGRRDGKKKGVYKNNRIKGRLLNSLLDQRTSTSQILLYWYSSLYINTTLRVHLVTLV